SSRPLSRRNSRSAARGARDEALPRIHGGGDRGAHGRARRHRQRSARHGEAPGAQVDSARSHDRDWQRAVVMTQDYERWADLADREAIGEVLSQADKEFLRTFGATDETA